MGRPKGWKRREKYVYEGGGRLWIRIAIKRSDGRRDEYGPRRCPEEWGTGRVGVAQAVLRAEEIAKQLRDGTLSSSTVVSETVWEFAQRMRARENNRATTEARWKSATTFWRDTLGALEARAIRRRDVEEWYSAFVASTDLEPGGVNLILSKLKWTLSRLHTDGLQSVDLSVVCRSVPVTKQVRANLTVEDLRPAFAGVWRDWGYFAILAVTGMRRGELENATLSQWSPPFLILSSEHVKTKVGRRVPIPAELHSTLLELLSKRTAGHTFSHLARKGFDLCGKPDESIHSLRRMAISDMSRLGIRRGVIKALVGHTGGDMTDHYDGAAGEETLRAVERYWTECVRVVYRNEPKEDN